MKTTPCPNLPRPPNIVRAGCAEAKSTVSGMFPYTGYPYTEYPYYIPFFSDYLWKLNNALYMWFSWMYTDLAVFNSGYPHLQWEDE